MKVSEITTQTVAEYLRLDEVPANLSDILTAATAYVSSYTGLPVTAEAEEDCLDNHEDVSIAVLVVCREMFDNRTLYADKSNANKIIENILGMHCRNLL